MKLTTTSNRGYGKRGMMSEIEKLYENAGVEKGWKPLPYGDIEEYYPEFTAEKQIELIKWLGKIYEVSINWHNHYNSYCIVLRDYRFNGRRNHSVCLNDVNFEETLATVINKIWQDLIEEEKAEIKEILK